MIKITLGRFWFDSDIRDAHPDKVPKPAKAVIAKKSRREYLILRIPLFYF
jgi:hypothetical protein